MQGGVPSPAAGHLRAALVPHAATRITKWLRWLCALETVKLQPGQWQVAHVAEHMQWQQRMHVLQ
jgi:hypothetical protein